jgi:hypothetical protein
MISIRRRVTSSLTFPVELTHFWIVEQSQVERITCTQFFLYLYPSPQCCNQIFFCFVNNLVRRYLSSSLEEDGRTLLGRINRFIRKNKIFRTVEGCRSSCCYRCRKRWTGSCCKGRAAAAPESVGVGVNLAWTITGKNNYIMKVSRLTPPPPSPPSPWNNNEKVQLYYEGVKGCPPPPGPPHLEITTRWLNDMIHGGYEGGGRPEG